MTVVHDRTGTAVYIHPITFDDVSGAPYTISFEHHEVHEGDSYIFTDSDGDLDDGEKKEYLICTGLTQPHFLFDVQGSLDTLVEIYEDATHNRGDAYSVFNRNRNSSNTNTTDICEVAGFISNGTKIFTDQFGLDAGGGVNRVFGGGESRASAEWVLKTNSNYYFVVQSNTDNNVVSVKMQWYEHTPTYT